MSLRVCGEKVDLYRLLVGANCGGVFCCCSCSPAMPLWQLSPGSVLGWLPVFFRLIVPIGRIFSMWGSLALLAGAILAACGFFVWRYVEQQRKQSTTMTRTKRRPF